MDNTVDLYYQLMKTDKSKILASAIKNILRYQKTDQYMPNNEVRNKEPLEKFLSGKQKSLVQSLEDILRLIKERKEMKDANISQIDKEICSVHSKIMNLHRSIYNFNEELEKNYQNLLQQSMTLYQTKRDEEIKCWKDILGLKSDLRNFVREMDQEIRKQDLIKGDQPW